MNRDTTAYDAQQRTLAVFKRLLDDRGVRPDSVEYDRENRGIRLEHTPEGDLESLKAGLNGVLYTFSEVVREAPWTPPVCRIEFVDGRRRNRRFWHSCSTATTYRCNRTHPSNDF